MDVGHIDKLHYVSTAPFNFVPMSAVSYTVLVMFEANSTQSIENNCFVKCKLFFDIKKNNYTKI